MAACWVILRGQQIYTVIQAVHSLLYIVAKCNFFSVVTWKDIIKYLQKCEGCTHFCEILYIYIYIYIHTHTYIYIYIYVNTKNLIANQMILIASIVLICKSLWIKASAKWLNVNVLIRTVCLGKHHYRSCSYVLLFFLLKGNLVSFNLVSLQADLRPLITCLWQYNGP